MKKDYGGVIWTNHAIERMVQRGIKQGDAWATWKRPASSKYEPQKGAYVFRRLYGNQEIEVVAKKNEKKQWLIISVWSNISRDNSIPKSKKSILQLIKEVLFKK